MAQTGDIADVILSGSTNAKPIPVVATATLGTTIHTAAAGTTTRDHVWLYAVNTDSSDRTLTLEWGAAGVGSNIGPVTIPANAGLVCVAENVPIENGLAITAFASSASKINIVGRVGRYTL